jgi:hypothetical protein
VTPEGEVLHSCLEVLSLLHICSWRNNTGAVKLEKENRFVRYGKVGSSDILGVLPGGRFLAVECKRPGVGCVSSAQREFLSEVERNGGLAVVVHSAGELLQKLKENGIMRGAAG